MKTTLLRSALAGLALITTSFGQTWTGAVSTNWDDAGNWNPATVPDNGATATFTAAGLDPNNYATDITTSTDHTLAGLVFAQDTRRITLYVGHDTTPTTLTFTGAGVTNNSEVQQYLWLTPSSFSLTGDVTLAFRNQATVAGDVRLLAIGANRRIEFHDSSSAGLASITSYNTDFYDQSTAAHAVFDQTMGGIVTFHDQSTGGAAKLSGFSGSVTFADSSSAGSATLVRPQPHGSSAQVFFRDNSSADMATLYLYKVEFSGNATAGAAMINTAGSQEYSSHGAYSTQFATTDFRDQSHAGDATIAVNPLATLSFLDDSSAERATLTNTGRVFFGDRATLGSARLNAGSGSYYGDGLYNQPAPAVATGGVLFASQATGGSGSIRITSAGAWLDFSGLISGTGTTGRQLLAAGSTPSGDVLPDDYRSISFGSLGNTVEGGRIFLGGTQLLVGSDNSDATLSARITDSGGAYGSVAGERLRGGGLYKEGTGTLTITNAENSYGFTRILGGTLRLGGGRINDAVVSAGARLTGNGTVQGSLRNAGLVSPGDSPGTITITGNYDQAATGTLAIEVGSATNYDRLVVGGTATLGGTLSLSLPGGFVPVGNTNFDFITAAAISGQFSTVVASPSFGAALSSQLAYTSTGVKLQVTQHPFATFGGTSPAGAALGAHLDATVAGATGDYRDLGASLNTLSSSTAIATALDALAPDRYSALVENSFLAAATQQAARDRRFTALRTTNGNRFDVFFEVGQRRTNLESVSGLPEARSSLAGGTAGAAWHNEGFALGAAVTQEDGDLDLDGIGSKADLKSTMPAVFFQYAADKWFVNASAAFSRDDYNLQRRVVFAGFDHTALGTTSGTRNDFAANVGTTFRSPSWVFTPQVGVLASRWELDRFTETGAAGANLTIFDQSISSLRTRAGFEATATGQRFSPQIAVFWLHETKDDRSLQAAFAGAGNSSYAAPGRPVDANAIQASVGVDCRLGKHAVLNASVAGLWGGNARVTSDISAAFRWEF